MAADRPSRREDATEVRLPPSEELHRLIAENVADVIWLMNLDLRYVYVSPSIRQQRGYAPEDFLGKSSRDLVSEKAGEIQRQYEDYMARFAVGDPTAWDPWTSETELRRKDGSVMCASIRLQFIPGPDGRPSRILGVTRDVTERRRAELEARRFKLAADSSSEIMAGLNERFEYIFANAAYLAKHGLDEAGILGRHFSEVVGPAAFEQLEPFLKKCLGGERVSFEATHDYPGEGLRYMEVTYFPLQESERYIGVVGVARDITASKLAEQALRHEAAYRQLLGDISNRFINLSPDEFESGLAEALQAMGSFIEADQAYVALFDEGRTALGTTNEWCRQGITPPRDSASTVLEGSLVWLGEQLRLQHPIAIQDVTRLPDAAVGVRGRCRRRGIQSIALIPLVSDRVCMGVLGFHFVAALREFSDGELKLLQLAGATISSVVVRQRAEEQRKVLEAQLLQAQKLEGIGRLAGGIAHDFNNTLSAILGTVELLMEDLPLGEPARRDVAEIAAAAQRAAELTHQLLAFSRRQVIEPKVVRLDQIVRELEPMLIRLLGEDVRLVIAVTARRTTVRVDVSQLEQVVINLAVNAREAMPRGGELRIEVGEPSERDAGRGWRRQFHDTVVLAVKDQGIGIPLEMQERIFEPFFTTKGVGQGSGWGLATVLGMVEQNSGRIFVESAPGQGTCFRVLLPAVPGGDTQSRSESPRAGGDETILVVEDDASVRKLAVRQLSRLGYHVLAAASGDEALRITEEHSDAINLLLTDVVMPTMNGRELAERLRERLPGIKVLYSSGYTYDVIADHGVLPEGMQFIAKPYSTKTLGEAVAKALASS